MLICPYIVDSINYTIFIIIRRQCDIFCLLSCSFGIILQCFPLESGKINFESFCKIVMPLMEEEDMEAMYEELKQAFRIYDRTGDS